MGTQLPLSLLLLSLKAISTGAAIPREKVRIGMELSWRRCEAAPRWRKFSLPPINCHPVDEGRTSEERDCYTDITMEQPLSTWYLLIKCAFLWHTMSSSFPCMPFQAEPRERPMNSNIT